MESSTTGISVCIIILHSNEGQGVIIFIMGVAV